MNIALIIGCPRSGTSILGELVAAHPDVSYIFEAAETWERAGLGINESHRLEAEHAQPRVARKIQKWFEAQQRGASIVVEKSPRNALRVPFIRAIFPQAKIIHIIRDGRDVACSLLPGIGGEEWLHAKPPSWQLFKQNYQGVLRCAAVWKEIVQIARADLQNVPHLQIKYDDLVHTPALVATQVLDFLGLPPHASVDAFCTKVQNQTRDSYHAKGQVQWYRPDHPYRIDRWRHNLTPAEQDAVHALIGDLLQELGFNNNESHHPL